MFTDSGFQNLKLQAALLASSIKFKECQVKYSDDAQSARG